MEGLVCLALAVILFRGFAVEGYMISTGSMAPCLLGYHRQVVCPSCSFAFSRGTHFDAQDTILAVASSTSDFGLPPVVADTVCPNCGLAAIDASGVPRNEGDQLLVQKHLYQLRSPKRWEVVVFRHPNDPEQAYVKRVVGLPNEQIELIDGDVYADGVLQRKPAATQRSMRIPVYDQDYEPTDQDWRPRWRANAADTRWAPFHSGFVYRGTDADIGNSPPDWLTYHHWLREGGQHHTFAELTQWPAEVPPAAALDRRLSFHHDEHKIAFIGVMPQYTATRLRSKSQNPQWLRAIDDLAIASHESPIVDQYGYNHPDSSNEPYDIHDLMVEAAIRRVEGEGEWRLRMTDGWHEFDTVIDFGDRTVRLHIDGNDEPVREAALPDHAFTAESLVEVSLFDRQVQVSIDNEPTFKPLVYAIEERPRHLSSRPVQMAADGINLQLSHLRLYRDVYYTPKPTLASLDAASLGPDEYFMLGDNSPVSVDSRKWESPAIPRSLLIGKPFLVHLPSRQGTLEFAGSEHHIRIPDFTRVRYIR